MKIEPSYIFQQNIELGINPSFVILTILDIFDLLIVLCDSEANIALAQS